MSHKAAKPPTAVASAKGLVLDDPAVTNAAYWLGWLGVVKNVAAFLVAIGVAGEFLGDWLAAPYQKVIDDKRDLRVNELNTRALEAEATIKRLSSSRSLNEDEAKAFVERLLKYPDKTLQNLIVGASPETFESSFFAEQITRLLKAAGFNPSDNQGFISVQMGVAKGVVAGYIRGNSKGERFAREIAKILSGEGVVAVAQPITGPIDQVMDQTNAQMHKTREDPAWGMVAIVVGDKI